MIQFFDVTDEKQPGEILHRDKKNGALPPLKKKGRNHHKNPQIKPQPQPIIREHQQLDCTISTCAMQDLL